MGHEIVYINKVGLEYLITFHDAQFGITDGCYCNEGSNTTINNVIKETV